MLTDAMLDVVKGHPPEEVPYFHEWAWSGSPAGAWRFWHEVWLFRKAHPASKLEE